VSFDLSADLQGRLKTGWEKAERSDLLGRAIDAAVELQADKRAWALVRLGGALRDAGRHDQVLWVLDVAVAFGREPLVKRAAFTCAAGVHCDLGNFGTARAICEQERVLGFDEELLRGLVRAAWGSQTIPTIRLTGIWRFATAESSTASFV